MRLLHILFLGFGLTQLAACQTNDLMEPPAPLGDFVLGLNIVVAENPQTVPVSRIASPEQLKAGLTKAIDERFGRYDGTRIYNLGVSIDGYALAPPGVPVLVRPQSALIITANIWDDATQTKLNPEGKQLTVLEKLDADTAIGSGWTRNKDMQIQILSYNAAKAIENWLADNPEWFDLPPLPSDGTEAATTKPTSAAKPKQTPAALRPKPRPLDFPLPNG
jgi:hypothetical protein